MEAKTIPQTEDWDLSEFEKIRLGYDVKIARDFSEKLRSLCAEHDLIHIAEKRWAGQEFDPKIHDDSNNYVDTFIKLIISEHIHLLKEEHEDSRQ